MTTNPTPLDAVDLKQFKITNTYVIKQGNEFIYINKDGIWDTTPNEDLAMQFSESDTSAICCQDDSLKATLWNSRIVQLY